MSDTKKRRTELSTTGRVVAILVGVSLFPASMMILEPPSGWLEAILFLLVRIVCVVHAAILAGRLWDRVTGSKHEEVRGRRSWSNDPAVQKVQSMEETHMLIAALCVAFMLFGGIVAMWRGGMHTLAGVMSAMAVVSALLAWLLTKKRHPYRPRDRHKHEAQVKTRRELNKSMPWADE